MKAVAYHRSRRSEPEASDLALRIQHEAVREFVEESGLDLVVEFTEREGEEGSESYPAYVAAVRAAIAHKQDDTMLDVALIIASQAGIGSGEPFEEPGVEGDGGMWRYMLDKPLIPAALEILLPAGAPSPLCLYADFRPRQLDTLIYLCNAGPGALAEVAVATDHISMHQFYQSEPDERWAELDFTGEERWPSIPPGSCVLIASLDHFMWDEVNRYRLAYTDATGQRWTGEAHDLPLNACRLAQDPDKVWLTLSPARAMDQIAPGMRPEETP